MIRTSYFMFFAILVTVALTQFRCATIIQSECDLQFFEGTYVGRYSLGVATLPVDDTVIISVDLDNNKALLTSKGLGAAFEANYQENNKRLIIGLFTAPVFVFGTDTLFDITIQSGNATLDPQCSNLFIELNDVVVNDYTDGLRSLLGAPPLNLNSLTGKDMRRIR